MDTRQIDDEGKLRERGTAAAVLDAALGFSAGLRRFALWRRLSALLGDAARRLGVVDDYDEVYGLGDGDDDVERQPLGRQASVSSNGSSTGDGRCVPVWGVSRCPLLALSLSLSLSLSLARLCWSVAWTNVRVEFSSVSGLVSALMTSAATSRFWYECSGHKARNFMGRLVFEGVSQICGHRYRLGRLRFG